MSHTPGPWTVGPKSLHVFGPEGQDVCTMGQRYIQSADARLIAAAPDLLDAAKAVTAAIDGYPNTVTAAEMARSYTLLYDAIARAEGR